jgi:hypothetical protein
MTELEASVGVTGVGSTHWQEFDTISPGGLSFAGYLRRQEREWLGTLPLTQVEG